MKIAKSSLLILIVTGCTSAPFPPELPVAHVCDELAIIGRIVNGDYHPVEDPNYLLGHGWVDAEIVVNKIVEGSWVGGNIPIRYFAHAMMREDKDFLFALSPTESGVYEIDSAHLMSENPVLDSHCDRE